MMLRVAYMADTIPITIGGIKMSRRAGQVTYVLGLHPKSSKILKR